MGETSQRSDLLRILLADDDDVNAFVFQCGINRLSQPCAFQRVANRASLPEKIASFRPDVLIAAGTFAQPGELKQIKQLSNGHPIICVVETRAEAEASLAAGAADCVLISQREELGRCLERHLTGHPTAHSFRQQECKPPRVTAKSIENRLNEIDRQIGAFLRRSARRTKAHLPELSRWMKAHLQELLRRMKAAGAVARDKSLSGYKDLNARWASYKKEKLPPAALPSSRSAEAGYLNVSSISTGTRQPASVAPRETVRDREFVEPTGFQLGSTDSIQDRRWLNPELAAAEATSHEALRALEISFKTLFHTALDPMFLVDGLGAFLHANAAGCALVGIAPAELLGRSLLEFVPAEEKAQATALWEALLIEGQQKAEIHVQSASGQLREVLLAARSNLWFGVHLLVLRDQTELKTLQLAARAETKPV